MSPKKEHLMQMVQNIPDEKIDIAVVFIAGLIGKEEESEKMDSMKAYEELMKFRKPRAENIDIYKERGAWRDEKYGSAD